MHTNWFQSEVVDQLIDQWRGGNLQIAPQSLAFVPRTSNAGWFAISEWGRDLSLGSYYKITIQKLRAAHPEQANHNKAVVDDVGIKELQMQEEAINSIKPAHWLPTYGCPCSIILNAEHQAQGSSTNHFQSMWYDSAELRTTDLPDSEKDVLTLSVKIWTNVIINESPWINNHKSWAVICGSSARIVSGYSTQIITYRERLCVSK